MSNQMFENDGPKKARKKGASGLNAASGQGQEPRGAHDPSPQPAPKEQGGTAPGDDQTYASGQTPTGATPLGSQPCPHDEPVEPFDEDGRRQLVLVKNGHRYVFRYAIGEETKVLAGLVEMARDPHSELDWFDAAVLSHQLGQRMSEQLDRLRRA
ncbi:MAG: hypothetical protein WD768_07330 [Phycisphaeraceae bacterium]